MAKMSKEEIAAARAALDAEEKDAEPGEPDEKTRRANAVTLASEETAQSLLKELRKANERADKAGGQVDTKAKSFLDKFRGKKAAT